MWPAPILEATAATLSVPQSIPIPNHVPVGCRRSAGVGLGPVMPSIVHAAAPLPGAPWAGEAVSVALETVAGRTDALGPEVEGADGRDAGDPPAACDAGPAAPHAAGDARIRARTSERTTCNGW